MKKILLSLIAIIAFTSISFSQVPSYVASSGLIAWWPFTGNAIDSSGNGNNGSVVGTSLSTDRKAVMNSCYDFDYAKASWGGRNDEIYIPYNTSFNVTNISVSVWVYPRSYFWTGDPSDPNSVILNRFQYGYSTPNGQVWGIGFNQTSVTAWVNSPSGSTGDFARSINPLTLNSWHHIVMTYDGSNIKLYVDGILAATKSYTGGMNVSGNSGISIGESNQANGYWYYTDGKIDDIGIWNRALSDCEISKLYLASNTFFTSKPADQAVKIGASASFTIKDTLGTSATYQWQENAGTGFVNLTNISPYSGVTTKTLNINPVAVGMHNNQYRCIRNSGTSCLDTSAAAVLTISNLGITPNQLGNVSIVPNPVLNKLNINAPCSINKLMLLNLMGQVVYTANPESNTASIDMSQYPTGIYILKVNDVWVEKIIKE